MNFFISYRRKDSTIEAQLLHQLINTQFPDGNHYFDNKDREWGIDVIERIKTALEASDVVLAVVGPDWIGHQDVGTDRINQDEDLVRFELETALELGLRIVPIVLCDEPPKDDDLPEKLQGFFRLRGPRPHLERFTQEIAEFLGHQAEDDDDTRPLSNQAACVSIQGELRWLRPEPDLDRSVAHPDYPADVADGSSLALSSDAVVAAQIVGRTLTIWALADLASGSYDRWRTFILDEHWQGPTVVAVRREGPWRVQVALSYEKLPNGAKKVARLTLEQVGTEIHPQEQDGHAVCGAFADSGLLYVCEITNRIQKWDSGAAVAKDWMPGDGLQHRWVDAAIVEGDELVAVLWINPKASGQGSAVTTLRPGVGWPGSRVRKGPTRARQVITPRRLDLGVGPQVVVNSAAGWDPLGDD